MDNLYQYLLDRQSPKGEGVVWIQSAERDTRVVGRGGEGKGKGKGKARQLTDESDDDNGGSIGNSEEEDVSEGKSVDDGSMDVESGTGEGSGGGNSKRHHRTSGSGDASPAKKQRKMVAEKPSRHNTRYGASHIDHSLC
jgi:hypothetical protein